MAEFDWSINWSSVRKYHRPAGHPLQVFVDGEEVTHVRRCITGESGMCAAFGLDAEGSPRPYLDRILYGDVQVREKPPEEEVPEIVTEEHLELPLEEEQ